jgi:predicted dehydrogenase
MAVKARLGIIGAGWWATANHLPILKERPDVELVAVCRLGKEELKKVAEAFGFRIATEDYRQLLEQADLDGVIVASPPAWHYEHARAALERSLHVLIEKPMCLRAREAHDLLRLARQNGCHIVVAYGWHYKEFVQLAATKLREGVVGQIEYVLCHMASPIRSMLTGQPRQRSDEEAGAKGRALFRPDPTTWSDPQLAGGGYGQAQLSHATGLMFWLTGLRAARVFALMSHRGHRVDLHDALSVEFRGGAVGTVSGSAGVPEKGGRFQLDIRIFGSDGMLLLDLERARLEIRTWDGQWLSPPLPEDAGRYSCEGPPHNFVDLILGKTNLNWAPPEAAAASVELLEAAYRSAASGQPESVTAGEL